MADEIAPDRIRFGPFTLHPDTHELRRDGTAIELRPKAFDTLAVLAAHAGKTVSKDILVAKVWPDVIVNDDSLAQCIRDIRKALGDDANLVRTIPRRGYRLDVPLPQAQSTDSAATNPRDRTRTWLLAFLTLCGLAAGAWWVWPQDGRRESTRLTVAVVPFDTGFETSEQRWLGDGIAEDVMTELSRFRDIGVLARHSSFRYAGAAFDLAALRDSLNVDFVVQGSVRRNGAHVRLALQLVDARTGTNVFAERYDAPISDLPALETDIVRLIASRLVTEARAAEVSRISALPPTSLNAWELTLRARHAYNQFTRESTFEALELIEHALATDPAYARAWEVLGTVLIQFYVQPYDARRGDAAVLARAVAAARKSVELDPLNPRNLASLGWSLAWLGAHDEAIATIERAIDLNPAEASFHGALADVLGRSGNHARAIEVFAERARLDPVEIPLNFALEARSHLMLGNAERAFQLTSACLERQPSMMPCHLFHIMTAEAVGDVDAMAESGSAVRRLAPRFRVSDWSRIIRFGDDATEMRLSAPLLAAGLPH